MENGSADRSFVVEAARFSGLSDEKIVRLLRPSLDEDAFAELLHRHQPVVRRLCSRILRNPADVEEAVQEVFYRALKQIDMFRGENFRAWLLSIARHHCLNIIARRRESPAELPQDLPQPHDTELSHLEEQLREELEKLPQHQRICLNLFYGEGHSYEEVSAMTGYSLKQVKSYIQNGKRNLKKSLDRRKEPGS